MGLLDLHYRMPLMPMADNTRAALLAALKEADIIA